jgi:hypothetical protein
MSGHRTACFQGLCPWELHFRALLQCTLGVRSGSIASVAPCCRCDTGLPPTTDIGLQRSTSSVCPRPAVGDNNGGTETGYRWRYAWDTVSPSASGRQMHQFCRIFNGLFPRYKSPSAPRLLIDFDGLPRPSRRYLFIVPPLYEIAPWRTNVRTNWRWPDQSLHTGGCIEKGYRIGVYGRLSPIVPGSTEFAACHAEC